MKWSDYAAKNGIEQCIRDENGCIVAWKGVVITMTNEELREVLQKHKMWLGGDSEGIRADLCGADLREANLRKADLCKADLCGADLRGADLCGADLCGADLCGADLRGADLCGADLCGADLCGADLREANLRRAENMPFIPLTCPEEGSFIGFKKVKNYIIKLEIPAEAKRSSATTNKCRCEYAKVIEITNLDGSPADTDKVVNYSYNETVYKAGETVYPDSFDEDRWKECSHGIHFFINRQEAVEY